MDALTGVFGVRILTKIDNWWKQIDVVTLEEGHTIEFNIDGLGRTTVASKEEAFAYLTKCYQRVEAQLYGES